MPPETRGPLEPEDVIPYLLEAGVATPESIVRNQAEVSVHIRKNISYVVDFGDRSFLVKRAKILEDPGVDREAAFYAKVLPSHEDLRAFTPDLLLYDPNRSHIIIRHFSHHMDLRRRFMRSRHTPASLGAQLGCALAALHSTLPTNWEKANFEIPELWVLSLLEPSMDMLVTESLGTIEMIRRVQATPVLALLIERALKDQPVDGLCHGDMRLDNLLYGSSRRLIIVDWELSGLGSTAWDLACLLASFVEFWATGAVRPHDDPSGAVTSAKRSLARFHLLLKTFWQEYRQRRCPPQDWPSWSKRVAELTGLRLIQSALEYSQLSAMPTRESIMLLTMAERFASRPMECWVHILGLPLSSAASGKISLE
ncbi:aminoglycoside phosphotransferase family protein [Bradyrhizobium japonicum]|uniref:aminoglycoside phosphotransferase family protein n=1 Tax=Bradyrhizobium japonicum TaxID=375 RepID=UPI000576D29D|nr:aminoglycoside phosphotransferase family protein [Bradyrhizobium japonicum]